jgi:heme A synthase
MIDTFRLLAKSAVVLCLVVVVLGAWVRLTDAGLGCPDWPGCYGQIVVPEDPDAAAAWPERPLESGKAWREMIHRYAAATLGLLIVALAVMAWRGRGRSGQPVALPTVLLGLVIFQGMLGMWTVTLLLKPLIVTAHLLGGMTTLALLFWLARRPLPPPWPCRSRWGPGSAPTTRPWPARISRPARGACGRPWTSAADSTPGTGSVSITRAASYTTRPGSRSTSLTAWARSSSL